MRTVREIYEAHRIMPGLQLHQLRVASVAKTIIDNLTREVDERSVLLACLFHDMGNIIKSDLGLFPELVEPEGVAHWQLVKDDFVKKYGRDEHHATAQIAREIGLPDRVLELIHGISFSKLGAIRDAHAIELKLVEYADLRVGPHGVLSMSARIEEAKGRYAGKHPDMPRGAETFERLVAAAYEIEQQLFSEATLAPEDITEQSVSALIGELREYQAA